MSIQSTARLAAVLVTGTLAAGGLQAADPKPASTNRSAVGSWFGRAVPVPGKTLCPPGNLGCPVPAEIVMVFTVHADGTFIGIDSNIFAGGNHSTAHGEWVATTQKQIKATFTLLQSAPVGTFIGGFKNLFEANVIDDDNMEGGINAFLYQYTDASGRTINDKDGFPTPSPLELPEACQPAKGCTPLGQFSFKVKRVSAYVPAQ
jgi:hypothetical protein